AHDHHGVTEQPAQDHGVEAGEAARVAIAVGGLRAAALDVEREDGDALGGDGERVLALLVRAAAVLVDLDRAAAPLAVHDVAQHDDHVAAVLPHAAAGYRPP